MIKGRVIKARKKRSDRQKAKDAAWDAFSLFVRTRDSIKTTNSTDMCKCVTCNRLYPRIGIGCIQAGHFIPGRLNAVLFSERGVHGQCLGCNGNPPIGKGGNRIEYWLYMEREYGRQVIDELIAESKPTVQYKEFEYREIAENYQAKTEWMLRHGKIE